METPAPGRLIARQDHIPIWSLPGIFVWAIGIGGIGFLFNTGCCSSRRFIPYLGAMQSMNLIAEFLAAGAGVARLGTPRSRRLDVISQ